MSEDRDVEFDEDAHVEAQERADARDIADLEEDDLEDDVPEDDLADDESEVEEPAPAARPPSRGESRIQALENRTREAERRAQEAERRAEEATRTRNTEDFRRQEQERLENMSSEERIEYRVNQRLNQIQFSTWDTNDRVQFDALANSNPAVSSIKAEVEQIFQDRIKQGAPVDRSTIATFLIGQKALAKAPRARAAGKRAEQAGRERNQVRAPSARGDAAPAGRVRMSEQEARAKRLENVTF